MTEREALYAAILANPDDDLPRLVWADWLEEHGEPERAAHIRAQVELSRLVVVRAVATHEFATVTRLVEAVPAARLWESLEADGLPLPVSTNTPGRTTVLEGDALSVHFSDVCVTLRRGMVEEVTCRTKTFLSLGAAFAASAQLRRVRLSDKVPWAGGLKQFEWWRESGWNHSAWASSSDVSGWLPGRLYNRLRRTRDGTRAVYPSEDAALDDLADTCLAYARGLS